MPMRPRGHKRHPRVRCAPPYHRPPPGAVQSPEEDDCGPLWVASCRFCRAVLSVPMMVMSQPRRIGPMCSATRSIRCISAALNAELFGVRA